MFRFVILTAFVTSMVSSTIGVAAHAGNIVQLNGAKKSRSVQVIGEAPVKKIIVLKLGDLRSGDPELPPRLLTREERMKLRAERAVQRQKQVTTARRERRTTSRTAQYRSPNGKSANAPPPLPPQGDDLGQDIAVNDQGDPVME